jgi:cytochrome c-type biogenesis protein CcsB
MNYPLIPVIGFYLASSACYGIYLFQQKDGLQRAGFALAAAGFAVHTAIIVSKFLYSGIIPVRNLHETLLFAAWIFAAVFLVSRLHTRLKVMGVFATPLITLITAAALFTPDKAFEIESPLASLWLVIHVILIFIGMASLTLAAGTGLLFLIQKRNIKGKKHRFFFKRLPSLEMLDNTGYTFVIIGFTALTAGLITGFVYAQSIWGHFWSWDPKEVWSAITWLIYAALLHERLVSRWRGNRAAILAIIGFCAMLFTFFGVNFFLEGHHDEFTRW